jgi:hypothetical protein
VAVLRIAAKVTPGVVHAGKIGPRLEEQQPTSSFRALPNAGSAYFPGVDALIPWSRRYLTRRFPRLAGADGQLIVSSPDRVGISSSAPGCEVSLRPRSGKRRVFSVGDMSAVEAW